MNTFSLIRRKYAKVDQNQNRLPSLNGHRFKQLMAIGIASVVNFIRLV